MKNILSICLLFFVLAVFSCKKQETEPVQTPNAMPQNVASNLPCSGFDPTGATYENGMVKLEGDILVDENLIANPSNANVPLEKMLADIENPPAADRQYAISFGTPTNPGLVTLTNVAQIKYWVDPALTVGVHKLWSLAIGTAINDWNIQTNCRVNFNAVSTEQQADLAFKLVDNNWTCGSSTPPTAVACLPWAGKVGKYIKIQADASFHPNFNLVTIRRRVMRHEIGHTIGLRHSCPAGSEFNQFFDGCGNSYNSMNLITGTPPCDAPSVMRSFNCGDDVSNNLLISPMDRLAAQYMYPESYTTPTIVSITKPSPGKVKITTATTPQPQKPYLVAIARYAPGSSTILQATGFYDPNNNKRIYEVTCPSGTWAYKVFYVNYGNYGVISNPFNVTVP